MGQTMMATEIGPAEFDYAEVAAEYLSIVSSHSAYRIDLIRLAELAYDGDWPVSFYLGLASFLDGLPWLQGRIINPSLLHALKNPPPYPDEVLSRISEWKEPGTSFRKRTPLRQFEGLLLLVKAMQLPEIHDQLARVIDLVSNGLPNNKGGTAKNRGRRHPVKDALYEIRSPQSLEDFARGLDSALRHKALIRYPRFVRFLAEACLPIMCGQGPVWAPSNDPADVLGLDSEGESPDKSGATDFTAKASVPHRRQFNASDLVGELSVMITVNDAQRAALAALEPIWRGEDTWDFFESVFRISQVLTWVRSMLQEKIDMTLVLPLNREFHNTKRLFASGRALKWRAKESILPQDMGAPRALISPSDRERRLGIFHLRGLLILGRLSGHEEKTRDCDLELGRLIDDLQRRVERALSDFELAQGIENLHPVERVLDQIGQPKTLAELASAIARLLPEIATVHPDAARLLRDHYLPLLTGQPAIAPSRRERVRKARRRTKPAVRRMRVPATRDNPLPGESPEEAEPEITIHRRSDAPTSVPTIKEELQWIHQRIWGANPLLVRSHFASMCDTEAALFINALRARMKSDISAGKLRDARTGLLVSMTLLTGQAVRVWAAIEPKGSQTNRLGSKPILDLHAGFFSLPIICPENAFVPSNEKQSELLESSEAYICLHLPPSLQSMAAHLVERGMPAWGRAPEDLREEMEAYVADVASVVGTGITLPRIRNFARGRLREFTNDTTATMILCGDSFGLSSAPLYYANFRVESLESAYRDAMWPLFGDSPHRSKFGGGEARLGSQLLVTHDAGRELARAPGLPMHASGKKQREGSNLVSDHNALTNHLLCMLVGASGHRPTSALLALSRFDFDTDLHAAIFRDKQCDPSHFYRYVPIADLVSEQVELYLSHLRALTELKIVPVETVLRANRSVLGEEPLFFHLTPDGLPVDLTLDYWRNTLPQCWQILPLNWGRTWLASRGREKRIEADHLGIALGHLEATGYPFSIESPMEPACLSAELSAPLGDLARESGWVARKGMHASRAPDSELGELGPIRDWRRERQQHLEEVRAFQVEQRQAQRSTVKSKREAGERIVHDTLEQVLKRNIPGFDRFSGRRHRKNTDGEVAVATSGVELSLGDLDDVQQKIDQATSADRALAIASHNALYRYLKNASKRLNWKTPIPGPWLSGPTSEPTPFFSGMLRATAHLRAIRERFGRTPVKPPSGTGFSDFEWACGIALIALCAFEFEDNPERAKKILQCSESAERSSAIKDLLFVEVEPAPRRRVSAVRGLAAIAIARLKKDFPSQDVPEPKKLDEVLASQLPEPLVDPSENLLDRLCATVAVANLVELSGLTRLAINENDGCVSMSVARQRQFLEEGRGPVGPVPRTESERGATVRIVANRCMPSTTRRQFRQLREILFVGEGPKTFGITGEVLSQANIVAFRGPMQRELEAFLALEGMSALVACIGSFALHLTTNGTPDKKEPAWSTVYKYVTSFGSDLVELGQDLDFTNLDSEDYLALYQLVLDRKGTDLRKIVAARELAHFHTYLQEHHDLDVVDFSDIEDVRFRPEQQVDAEVVQPQEFLAGIQALSRRADVSTEWESADPERTRLDRQALVFSFLIGASGARLNELSALRFKDVLATSDNTVLLIRASRYRRLKTSAARRIIDCSKKLSRIQKGIVAEWINAEKARIGGAWKPTLPIFGKIGSPKERVASSMLRDVILEVLGKFIGFRSKIHRIRHLVAGEDLLAIWLSERDFRAIRRTRIGSRRFVRRQPRSNVILPRHVREHGLRFGHRRSSTTLRNYFHMPWATLSRPHEALRRYVDRHSAAVVLGLSVAGADKIVQRLKSGSDNSNDRDVLSHWLSHRAGQATRTPGSLSDATEHTNAGRAEMVSARSVEKVLRQIQRGMSIGQACLVHGFGRNQVNALNQAISEIERKTAFRVLPKLNRKRLPRTVRRFKDTDLMDRIIEFMDAGQNSTESHVESVARAYLLWASKSQSERLLWPAREVRQLIVLLKKAGVDDSAILKFEDPESAYLRLQVIRSGMPKQSSNNAIAWSLVVAYATMVVRQASEALD